MTNTTAIAATKPPADNMGGSSPRLHFIDGLRGLAMLMVLFYHSWLFGGMWHLNLPLGHHRVNVLSLLGFGHVGVNLFLVLSGFCLYWPFVKRGTQPEPTLWQFAKKRCRRILPPYYVTLLIFGTLPLVQAWHHHSRVDMPFTINWLWMHAVMVHNLRPDYVLSVNGSLWSLGLEFQLYILFPVLVEAYRRFRSRGVVVVVLILSSLYRFVVAHGNYTPDDGFGSVLAYSVFGRCFEFALGMFAASVVAAWHKTGRSPLCRSDLMLPVLIIPVAILDGRHGHFRTLTDAVWGILFVALLVGASRSHTLLHRWLSHRWLVACGVFSYSVYLIHLPLVMAMGAFAARHQFSNSVNIMFQTLFVVPAMLGLGYVFHLLFEKPFMTSPPSKPTLTFSPAPSVPAAHTAVAAE